LAKARIQVKLDSPAVRALLKSSEVETYLLGIAETVAANAGPDYKVMASRARASRAMAIVLDPRDDAKFREMSKGTLARALGAATR
jgi:hypothetical protein